MMYTLIYACAKLLFCVCQLLWTFAMCTYPETAKNMVYKLCLDHGSDK